MVSLSGEVPPERIKLQQAADKGPRTQAKQHLGSPGWAATAKGSCSGETRK